MEDRLRWHVLWSPVGFGNTTAKLVGLREAAMRDDPEGGAEMYYPVYMDRLRDGQEVMVPLFPNYVFLRCRWHAGLEDRIGELSGVHAVFLRLPGEEQPHDLDEEEMGRVRTALEKRVDLVESWVHVEDLVEGDQVRVKSNGITGTLLYFLPPHRAMVETRLFNQSTPCPVRISDLERI